MRTLLKEEFQKEFLIYKKLNASKPALTCIAMVESDNKIPFPVFLKETDAKRAEIYDKLTGLWNPYIADTYEVLKVTDSDKSDTPRYFAVTEYVTATGSPNNESISLAEYIKRNGAVSEKMALVLCIQLCTGLKEFHEKGFVHRDLKPENVLASPDGTIVKIIDFDWVHLHASNVTVMLRREQKGTPGYADPRYWNSYICHPEMDIYSAGLVLYFIYTGKHHFYGSEEIKNYMIGDDYAYQLKEMPGIDERLSKIIAKMIAREEERYGSIKEVIQDMTAYLTSVRKLPELPELLTQSQEEKTIRFSYRIGDVKYSPYMKNYRFIPIEFGTKQERSQNGRMSGHILSFYRMDDKIKVILLHEDCHIIKQQREGEVCAGDVFTYAGTNIEILQIKR